MNKMLRGFIPGLFLLLGFSAFCVPPVWGAPKILGKFGDALEIFSLTLSTNNIGGRTLAAIITTDMEKPENRRFVVFDQALWKYFCSVLKIAHDSPKPKADVKLASLDGGVDKTSISISLDRDGEIVLGISDANGEDQFTLRPQDYARFDQDVKKVAKILKN